VSLGQGGLEGRLSEALTFDDVLLVPQRSDVVPAQVDVQTRLTRKIALRIPIVSAAMDTVTEAHLAIALAQEGGLGFVHKNMTIEAQAAEVDKVKRSESGMIVDPVTVSPDARVADALEVMARYRISGVPVTVGRKLVGILTNRDLRFETRTTLAVGCVAVENTIVDRQRRAEIRQRDLASLRSDRRSAVALRLSSGKCPELWRIHGAAERGFHH
jgi:IMP dehydrogenase